MRSTCGVRVVILRVTKYNHSNANQHRYDSNFTRKSTFDLSCITSATQDKYFTKRVVEEDQSESNDDENKVIALSVVAVCVGVGLIAFIVLTTVMYFRERRGDPMFKAVLLPRGDERSA